MDRLSALMSRFELRMTPHAGPDANFQILGHASAPQSMRFTATATLPEPSEGTQLFKACVDWGGADNPLLTALPDIVEFDLSTDPDTQSVAQLLINEEQATRCGVVSVLNRLCEVLIVSLLRRQIETGHMKTGLLGGLADARLSRAIVAIHDRPEEPWRADTLAREAGLSHSRFSELFREAVGETPLAYLRRWRLALARQDLARGDRVQTVAQRYCYGSTEALSRAVTASFGQSPMQIRKSARSG